MITQRLWLKSVGHKINKRYDYREGICWKVRATRDQVESSVVRVRAKECTTYMIEIVKEQILHKKIQLPI